jgi:hypothetical protein
VVSYEQLTQAMQASAGQLVAEAGLIPQAQDRPLDGNDLLFYLSETTMPMASFLAKHGLYVDGQGLHFDLSQSGVIRVTAEQIIAERQAGDLTGLWKRFDLSTDEDADTNGAYVLTVLAVLEQLYGRAV